MYISEPLLETLRRTYTIPLPSSWSSISDIWHRNVCDINWIWKFCKSPAYNLISQFEPKLNMVGDILGVRQQETEEKKRALPSLGLGFSDYLLPHIQQCFCHDSFIMFPYYSNATFKNSLWWSSRPHALITHGSRLHYGVLRKAPAPAQQSVHCGPSNGKFWNKIWNLHDGILSKAPVSAISSGWTRLPWVHSDISFSNNIAITFKNWNTIFLSMMMNVFGSFKLCFEF